MRLKHRQHTFASGRARGRERRSNLSRVMRVIVDQKKSIAFIFDLETPPGVTKRA
jgi:hypothetical protein